MMGQIDQRQRAILRMIVEEYTVTAMPVGSEVIAQKGGLGVSPATVRNEMSVLEEHGYIFHPHPSAGRMPSARGYRYFVETLMGESDLDPEQKRTIRHQFHQIEADIDEWMQLAAAVIANIVKNAALVTPPTAAACRLKYLDLVQLHEMLVLMIVALYEGIIKQHILSIPEPTEADELTMVSRKLTSCFQGLKAGQIEAMVVNLSPLGKCVREALIRIMGQVDRQRFRYIHYDGLAHTLNQPEFSRVEKMRALVRLIEERSAFAGVIRRVLDTPNVQLFIGEENELSDLWECSLVMTRYGLEGGDMGTLGVLGPIRMDYGRTISAVRFLSTVMNELLNEVYG
ncbi:MAG: heat-inducible transcriptional repressor HrcA [Chloroflexi bacterium]|nr:heat-inducible transcriptional repressor HrcA [Chloroflexota bacterium]